MANQDELFDFNDEQKQLQKLIDQFKLLDTTIMKVSADALAAGRNINAITLPSDLANFTAQNATLTATIQAQARELARLQTQYTTLTQQRQQSSQRTAEESVNQGILNRNAMEAARINSTLAGAYARLSAEQNRASRNLQDLIVRGRLATQTQREYDRELRIAQREFDTLNNRVLAADRAVGRFNRNVGNYPMQAARGIRDLIGAFGVAGGVALFAGMVKGAFDTAKELQSLNLALKSVTGTQAEFEKQQLFLISIADKYGLELKGLTEQFTSFYVSAKGKLAGKEIQEVFENISKSGSALGLSNDNLKRTFTALNQMLSKGKVASEELRGQFAEAMPGAVQAMTRAVQKLHPEIKNLTEKGLFEMIKNGKILAEEVLPETSRQLLILTGADKAEGIETLTKTTNRLTNSWAKMIMSINDSDSSGFAGFVKKIVGGLTTIIDFTGLLFKDEKQLQKYFMNIGSTQGLQEYEAILNNISTTSKQQQEATITALIERERQSIKTNQAIVASEKEKRKSILGGDRALFHLQTKEEEDALVRIGKSAAILKTISEGRFNNDKTISEGKKQLTESELKAIEDILKAKYDASKKELELRVLVQETILNGENESYENQYEALDKFLDLKMQIIKLDYNEQVRLAKGNKDKIRIAEIDAEMATIKQLQDGFNKTKAIRKKQNDEYIEEIKNVEKFLKDHEDEKTRIRETSDEFENDLFMTSWKAREEAYNKELERLKELKQATSDYLSTFGDEFMSNSGFGESFNTFFKQIKDANGEMTTMFKQLMEGADTTAKKAAVVFTSIAESAQEMYNFISNASQANFDGEKERLQSQYDVAFQYANGNKEAEEKLATDLEAKKKEIANREAKAKKQQAIFNIAIDTAQAIVSVLPNFVLAGLVAALGAVQIAMVSSQKIPQYFKGGVHDGGLMMVNDAPGNNFKETIVFPNGGIAQPEGRNVLMNAPAGTKIHTPDQWDKLQQEKELFNMLQPRGIFMNSQQAQSGFDYDAMDGIMNKYLGNVTVEKTVIDKSGFSNYVEKQGSKTKINRNFASSKGFRFS